MPFATGVGSTTTGAAFLPLVVFFPVAVFAVTVFAVTVFVAFVFVALVVAAMFIFSTGSAARAGRARCPRRESKAFPSACSSRTTSSSTPRNVPFSRRAPSIGSRSVSLHFLPGEAGVVRRLLQRPVEPRRAHFEPLVVDVLDGEQTRQMTADARTVLDVDTRRLVDENAHLSPLRRQLDVHELEAHRRQRALQKLGQIHVPPHSSRADDNRQSIAGAKKKWAAPAHFFSEDRPFPQLVDKTADPRRFRPAIIADSPVVLKRRPAPPPLAASHRRSGATLDRPAPATSLKHTMAEPIVIARLDETDIGLLPALANRHGAITGATGTGKTISMQVLAEGFSRLGVPVFMADVKGDFTGIAKAGELSPKLKERLDRLGIPEPRWGGMPVTLWDVWGEQGHPVRATISDMGPLLLARLLNLNDTQEGVLTLSFKVADDNKLLLLDLKDLRALLTVRRRPRGEVQDAVRQRLAGVDRRNPARPAADRAAGRRTLLRRADARHRRPDADRFARPRRCEHPRSRPPDAEPAAVFDVPALAARGTLRAAPRGGRPRQAEARVLLRRGASAVQRGPACVGREGRAGGAADPQQGRGRLLRDAESPRHPGKGAGPARQPRPARACARSRHATRKR